MIRSLAALLLLAAAAPAAVADDRDVVRRWQAYLTEIAELEGRMSGQIIGQGLSTLGTVGFVIGEAGYAARGLLPHEDRELIYQAVEGQLPDQLESNLPAIVNYVRLSAASRLYSSRAQKRNPLFGSRAGLDEVHEIAKNVHDFREDQVAAVTSGQIHPAYVLTRANLGRLGDERLFSDLEAAFRAGHDQWTMQRNLAGFAPIGLQVLLGALVAGLIRARRGESYSFLRRPRR